MIVEEGVTARCDADGLFCVAACVFVRPVFLLRVLSTVSVFPCHCVLVEEGMSAASCPLLYVCASCFISFFFFHFYMLLCVRLLLSFFFFFMSLCISRGRNGGELSVSCFFFYVV